VPTLFEWDDEARGSAISLEGFLGGDKELYLDVAAAIGEEPIIDI
jgi:hypothetical protein